MYATVRTYRADQGQIEEMLGILDSDFIPKITEQDGFCGYQAIETGDGGLVTVSCFTSREQAEASTEVAATFIKEKLSDFDIERTDVKSGAIRVSVAVQEMLEPAHV